MKSSLDVIKNEIINALCFLGEQCVARIRNRSSTESWIDHTGNLRSSIGYAIYNYGKKLMQSTFENVLNGSTGSSEGRKIVEELANEYSNVYALVVVAGMSYADYVEAINGKDVLASTELWAKAKMEQYLRLGTQRAIDKINKLKI